MQDSRTVVEMDAMKVPKRMPLICVSVALIGFWDLLAARGQDTAQKDKRSARSVASTESRKAPAVEAEGVSPLQTFKNFLSSTPLIESMVFRVRMPADTNAPWRADIPFSSSQNFRYYEARCQPGAFFLREVSGPDALLDERIPGRLAAVFDDQAWFHYGPSYRKDILHFGVGPNNRVSEFVHVNSHVFRSVLSLGLMSEVGAVEWEGNRFHVRKDGTPARFLSISGLLTSSSAGLVDSLRVTYSTTNRDIDWVIRYGYQDAGLPAGLPSLIRCFTFNDDQEIERDEYLISSLKMASAAKGIEAFRPDQFVATNRWQVHFYSNDEVYLLQTNGYRRLIERQGLIVQKRPPGARSPTELAAVYTLWAGANFWMFILAVRMSAGKQRKQ